MRAVLGSLPQKMYNVPLVICRAINILLPCPLLPICCQLSPLLLLFCVVLSTSG
jgi:hypothetical protein